MAWRWSPITAARDAEEWFDRFRFEFKRRFGLLDPFEILPYRGHGTEGELFLRGRVLEEGGVVRSAQNHTLLENLRNMARRFGSDEIAGARVRASFGGRQTSATTDGEGFFDVRLELEEPLDGGSGWHEVELELWHPPSPGGLPVRSTGQVLVPSGSEFGVISDLDDTVVQSGATNVLRMAWTVVRNNAHTRLPFEGVSAFYEALRGGSDGGTYNPIFYVSSSPWNIYDLLEDFLDVHGVPAGPLFLKDWSPTTLGQHEDHKLGIIRTLLETYPDLPFVLIGDSGEEDPEIYHQAVVEHPGRIRTIIIRDVTSPERDREVHAIAGKLRRHDVEMILTEDTVAAAQHAAKIGLIPPEAVDRVRARRDAPG